MMASSPICLLSKASKTKSWLWHSHLSHLNFGAINHLARQGLVRGLPKLKFEKDHLCSACAMGKSKKKSHKPKSEDTNQEQFHLLHMDLYGPMRVESVNEKKYILIIVDGYSRFTWVKFLRSKDEAPDFIIKFLKMIQVRLKVPVHRIRTDNGTEFVSQMLREYYEEVSISHEISVARSSQQIGVVERHNRTLIEAAITISGPALNEMTPTTISSGLVQKPSSLTPYVPPSRNDWDLLFQPMFDELLNPLPSVYPQAPEVIALITDVIPPVPAESTGLPSSTSVDQDAPPSMEPKTYKDALTQSCWIEAMQEELIAFERLEDSSVALTAFADTDHAGCQDTRRSTSDLPVIYMQEFWATTTVYHHSIRFKMDNKKHIINLESFREMLHICPRLPHQPFVEPPFEEEIMDFL
nr:retrovirus-related Pol polyprotein from transposon TNT 1-94 [Tanacetum cinerariifolium]